MHPIEFFSYYCAIGWIHVFCPLSHEIYTLSLLKQGLTSRVHKSLKWIAHFFEWKLFTAIPHSLLDRGNRFILLWAVEKLFGGWPFVHSVSCYLWPLQYFRSLLAWHKTLRKEFIEVENEDARLVVKKKIIVVIQFETCLEVHIIRYMPISITILLHFLLNSPSLLASGRKYRK